MINVEETLARVWENVGKLENEIETTIQKLCGYKILEPVEFFPIAGNTKDGQKPGSSKKLDASLSRAKPGPKCSKPGGVLSSKKTKRVDSSMDIDIEEDSVTSKISALNLTGGNRISDAFSVIEGDTFLTPVMDKWIFGATFVNSSNINDMQCRAQQLPVVILNLLGKENLKSKSFSYGYKTGLLNLESGDILENAQTLPVQEELQDDQKVVRPGCKFYATASFSQPILTDYDLPIFVSVSLLCDGNQIWSKCLPLKVHQSSGIDSDTILNQFQERIFMELSEYSEKFMIQNLHSPAYTLNDFFTKELGLSIVRTVQTRFDTKTDYFATRQLNSLWGLLIQVETCERASEKLSGIVYCRSTQQLDHFRKSFSKWVDQQKVENPSLKTILNQEAHMPAVIMKAIQDEIKTLIHFIYMQEQNAFQRNRAGCDSDSGPAPPVLYKWFQNYIQDMNTSDGKFM